MSEQFLIAAEPREDAGKGASRRLRRAGKVPGVLYGGNEKPVAISMDHNRLMHQAEHEAFFSSIVDVRLSGQTLKAVIKDVQIHPARRIIMHLDLQRVLATEKLRVVVPVHLLNEQESKGVKDSGGVAQHLVNEVEVECLPTNLPQFLALDITDLDVNESLRLSDIELPEGVEIPSLAIGPEQDRAVVTIQMVRAEAAASADADEEAATAAPDTDAAEGGDDAKGG